MSQLASHGLPVSSGWLEHTHALHAIGTEPVVASMHFPGKYFNMGNADGRHGEGMQT